jgi:hypothetical protein
MDDNNGVMTHNLDLRWLVLELMYETVKNFAVALKHAVYCIKNMLSECDSYTDRQH